MNGRRSIVVGACAVVLAAGLALAAPLWAADQPDPAVAVADTTFSQVPQDGDGSRRTTLATCPRGCDSNPNAERDAVLGFRVTLPANATGIRAVLKLYAWTATPARVSARVATGAPESAGGTGAWADRPALGAVLDTRASVAAGYNRFDVSAAVTGSGPLLVAIQQETHDSRVYWASMDNSRASIRPQLEVTYTVGTQPSPSSSPTSSPTPSDPAGWRLAWADEFNGTSLDATKWNARTNTYLDYDLSCITNRPQNISVSDGSAHLVVRRERATCGSQTREYTEPYLETIGKASFTYGRFEVRAKSPTGPTNSTGLWPAAWLRPDDGGHGEIDITELPGGAAWHDKSTQAIFYDYNGTKQDHRAPVPGGHPADGFHVYSIEWSPGLLIFHIDGQEVWRRDRGTTPWFDEAFSRPYHLRLNFQVGGWLGAPDAATAFPADFQVDYFRVYQRTV